MENKYCPKCGKELPAESQFCPYCMTKFGEANKIEPAQPKAKKPNKKLLLIIGIVVVISIAVAAIFAVPKLSNSDGSSDSIVGANGEQADSDGKNPQKDSQPKMAENDNGIGLMNIKINKNDGNLNDTQKLLVQYFDKDYFYPPYNSLQRYPQIYKDAQISFLCYVEKIIESTDTDYTILVEYDGFKPYDAEEKIGTGDYAVIKGKHTEARIMEGDSIRVFGIYNGVNTYSVDGKSYTVPTVNISRYVQVYYMDLADPMYTKNEITTIAKHVFGNDIKIRYTTNSDFPDDNLTDYEFYEGLYYTVEPDNQSNANFTKYMFFADFGGDIYDMKSEYPIQREITFSADFEHFYLQIFDKSLNVYTLECFDKNLKKVWSREFDQTTTAALDYTADHIYLVANGYMYIINAATGEDAVEKKYVGAKIGIRKFEDGLLLLAVNRSDAVMKTDLVGNVKWTANLSYDLPDPANGAEPPIVQVNGGNYVIQYYGNENGITASTNTAVISPDGEVISDSPAF